MSAATLPTLPMLPTSPRMRIQFVTIGSFGDVNPFIALGLEARQRGHAVQVVGPAWFAAHVTGVGLEFAPLGEVRELGAIIRERKLMHGMRSGDRVMQMILDETPRCIADLRAATDAFRPDVVVAHRIAFGARWVAQQRAVPYVGIDLAPLVWFSKRDPIPAMQTGPGRVNAWFARVLGPPMWRLLRGRVDGRLNAIRRRLGLPHERSPWERDAEVAAATLGLWSPAFRPPHGDDPVRSCITGFVFHDARADAAAPSDVERFLAGGTTPIVFALGSTAVFNAGDFYEVAARACERMGRRGLLLVGPNENAPKDLPGEVAAFGYAPYSTVFPRAAAVVVHGGIGSTAQGLRAGVPTLVVPFAHDQFNNGVRVHALGVGGTLPRSRVRVESMVSALRPLVEDHRVRERAQRLRSELARERGEGCALDVIESVVANARASASL
jgi:rhamnosyltransferase subunit B